MEGQGWMGQWMDGMDGRNFACGLLQKHGLATRRSGLVPASAHHIGGWCLAWPTPQPSPAPCPVGVPRCLPICRPDEDRRDIARVGTGQ